MPRILDVRDLGRRPFEEAFNLQEELVAARRAGTAPDTLLLCEHDPVYTLGRNASEHNVLASSEDLARRGIRLVRTTRGGDVTYHGPGQIVGYPVLSLADWGGGVVAYVGALEKTLLTVLADYGLTGRTDPQNRGVWVENDKIAALGIRVTRQITMHGFALNVRVNLADYTGIVPCGIRDKGVTSLDRFVPDVRIEEVKQRVVQRFREVLGYAA